VKISTAAFVISSPKVSGCPKPDRPEYAFIGRSNVGKSSLINSILQRPKLAKVSARPGKTQLINHFNVNDAWYLVDLPGYGFAKVSKDTRDKWQNMISEYIGGRDNLINLFVLIDCRLEPQRIDMEIMRWLGENGVPFTMLFTKADKLGKVARQTAVAQYLREMRTEWHEAPPHVITSAEEGTGRDEVLALIDGWNREFGGRFR
jgi:GTP-binding protein